MTTTRATITRIEDLLGQISARFAAEDPDEQAWLRDQCSPEAQRVLDSLSVQNLHLLDEIPSEDVPLRSERPANIIGLSRTTGVPKGTVSKAVQRLEAQGLLTRHRLPGNSKEVHLRLTAVGAEIQAAHRGLHDQMGAGLTDFLARYSDADLEVVSRVLSDLLAMPRVGLRFRPDLLD
ncbi:MAG TPA: MarR family transcriptional regulator [Ruania sp.]|nr:MarR family transcriptional regulator [Ruania sp.]